jgi:formylglycine-generating enzyme required for sulfatase activity
VALGSSSTVQKSHDEESGREANRPLYVNSIGIKMIRIPANKFRMGNDAPTDAKQLGQLATLTNGDYDEQPVHDVTISNAFYISETEITAKQWREFRADYMDAGLFTPYATGMSWYDAVAFCAWLSKKEKRTYRLPTEAEWEDAARAGTSGLFPNGAILPKSGEPNAWGVMNMNTDALEWVQDWYGPYLPDAQVDPVGPTDGDSRVIRGGGILGPRGTHAAGEAAYYRRSANRASMPPQYRGAHFIGFRVVEGDSPTTPPTPPRKPFPASFVKQTDVPVTAGPDSKKPWFRILPLLPIPPENMPQDAIVTAGIAPGILGHMHSAGVTVCPNGDLIWIAFAAPTPETEYSPSVLFVISRLRFGSEQWDFPEIFSDFADETDAAALLFNDNGDINFFGGGAGLLGVPFFLRRSNDNGATWSKAIFPLIRGELGGYNPQPISSAFRSKDGATLYVATDGVGSESLLWATKDGGKTWYDTGGRSAGRHTQFVTLKDGSILALGGKSSDIDGYMPQSISKDGGATWSSPTKTPFPALSSNQRPAAIRLASGRLFFASDYQNRVGQRPPGVTKQGAFVALSDDDGASWHIKTLPGTLPHESYVFKDRTQWSANFGAFGTLGYSVAAQGSNGLIHLITSMNHPSQEFEMNEAWIMSESDASSPIATSAVREIYGVQRYGDGKPQATWSGKIAADGRFLLNGSETWTHPNGAKRYEVTYRDGIKSGRERYWAEDGHEIWEWEHRSDGVSLWTQFWPNGSRKHQSEWRDGKCVGRSLAWDESGGITGQWEFVAGDLKK